MSLYTFRILNSFATNGNIRPYAMIPYGTNYIQVLHYSLYLCKDMDNQANLRNFMDFTLFVFEKTFFLKKHIEMSFLLCMCKWKNQTIIEIKLGNLC